ncbi:EexN family lipoprotein [Herbaspirillum autotrophicum]|uniref:EexN family lipoprotein n=1 Tax=Herbaspirillum autotrophicum TaxID=180195 RepID=UPI0012ECE09B|nr:EexN family lipoprotein [Herbaspirillum autotrophicum]
MSIKQHGHRSFFSTLLFLSLMACGEKSENAKSVDYYKGNLEEAKTILQKCTALKSGEVSTMSPSQRAAWSETTVGINCENARVASADSAYDDHQRSMREAAAKY